MDVNQVISEVAFAAINYIVISTVSSNNSKQTVGDLKLDLRTTKEDLMNEIKETREFIENFMNKEKGN